MENIIKQLDANYLRVSPRFENPQDPTFGELMVVARFIHTNGTEIYFKKNTEGRLRMYMQTNPEVEVEVSLSPEEKEEIIKLYDLNI